MKYKLYKRQPYFTALDSTDGTNVTIDNFSSEFNPGKSDIVFIKKKGYSIIIDPYS
jgi:hypothetical protein